MWGKTQQVAGYTDLTHLTVQGKCVLSSKDMMKFIELTKFK